VDAELLVQHLDFFRAERRNLHHRQQALRNRSAEFFVIFEVTGLDQLGDLLMQRLADAGQLLDPVLRDKLCNVPS